MPTQGVEDHEITTRDNLRRVRQLIKKNDKTLGAQQRKGAEYIEGGAESNTEFTDFPKISRQYLSYTKQKQGNDVRFIRSFRRVMYSTQRCPVLLSKNRVVESHQCGSLRRSQSCAEQAFGRMVLLIQHKYLTQYYERRTGRQLEKSYLL
jgi:hypothetical protein